MKNNNILNTQTKQSPKEQGFLNQLSYRVFDWVSKVDTKKVSQRIHKLKKKHPRANTDQLIDMLIHQKSTRTAVIGGSTSLTALVPGVGTLVASTLGSVLDLSGTIGSQAELVLEIAELLEVPLSEREKREAVFVVLGIGASGQFLSTRAGQALAQRVGKRYAQKWFSKAIPVVGILASGGLNYGLTRLIGLRAKAYFEKGPESMESWQDSLKTLAGLDDQEWAQRLTDSAEQVKKGVIETTQKGFESSLETGQDLLAKVSGKEKKASHFSEECSKPFPSTSEEKRTLEKAKRPFKPLPFIRESDGLT